MGEYTNINNADATLLALWKYFRYRTVALNFLNKAADAYEEHIITPVCPSVTRWTAHGRACKAVYDGYQQLLVALSVALNERREPEAMGLFAALAEEFLATLLLLRDIFDAIAPLNLALQKSHGSLCLSDVKTYIDKTQDALKKLVIKGHWFREEKFKKLKQIAADQTLLLPLSANL